MSPAEDRRRILDGLTPGQRAVIEAFDYRSPDCTYAAVALRLGRHVGTVWAWPAW